RDDPGVPQRGPHHRAEEGLLPGDRGRAAPAPRPEEAGRLHHPGGGEEGELVVRKRRGAVRLRRPAAQNGLASIRYTTSARATVMTQASVRTLGPEPGVRVDFRSQPSRPPMTRKSTPERRSHQVCTKAGPVIATAVPPLRSRARSPMLATRDRRPAADGESSPGKNASARTGPAQNDRLTTCSATTREYTFILVLSHPSPEDRQQSGCRHPNPSTKGRGRV